MLTKSDLATSKVIEGWLRDLALEPTARPDPGTNNWNLEFTVPGPSPLVINVMNPKVIPRGIMLMCGLFSAQEQMVSYSKLTNEQKRSFWDDLRTTLNREFVEFQIEGVAVLECPKTLRVSAVRFDDGLTLDSFARSVSSVCKACSDAVAHFTERLGNPNDPTGTSTASTKPS